MEVGKDVKKIAEKQASTRKPSLKLVTKATGTTSAATVLVFKVERKKWLA